MLKLLKSIKRTVGRPYRAFLDWLYRTLRPTRYKEEHELSYWRSRLERETVLRNDHYSYFYREYFGLDTDFYRGKKILDVGCGPRGSLEWATEAAERIGLDPLANEYLKLGADKHQMRYVDSPAEHIPFSNDYFDVVCTFNSLDHVANVGATASEIKRVLKPGGTFLIMVEVDHEPTACEPVTIHDVPALFGDVLELCEYKKFEIGDHDMYGQIRKGDHYDESVPNRPAWITARFMKPAAARN